MSNDSSNNLSAPAGSVGSQSVSAADGSSVSGVIQGYTVVGNIIVTGGQLFVGEYGPLRDDYIKPKSVFERVKLDHFVGRDWLVAEVEAFLRENECGYFVLEAKAGLGKTTFLAHLVVKMSCIHHFVELAPGPEGVAPGLKNLAAQLILAWKLDLTTTREVLPGRATRPDYLQEVIYEAARRRDEIAPEEKIIIVIDALDEAGVPSGQNVLGLPKVLPRGVYIIVSQRPVEVPLDVEPRVVSRLEASAKENIDDMKVYLERAAKWRGVSKELSDGGYTIRQFVDTLLNKCGGVWIYLHYIVGEIESGQRSPLALDRLPHGVWQYYAQYWRRWRNQHEDEWEAHHLPLLSTLSAAQEDVSLNFLCKLANVSENAATRRLLQETWRPFLVVKEGPRYRLYHSSLQEFLDGRADLTDLTDQEQVFTKELASATRRAHAYISKLYLEEWGGLEAGLPQLKERRDVDNGYGLRFLAAHLEGAGPEGVANLHALLRLEWRHQEETSPTPRPGLTKFFDFSSNQKPPPPVVCFENAWYVVHELAGDTSGYLSNIARAWRLAGTPEPATEEADSSSAGSDADRVKNSSRGGIGVGFQCSYALITASLNSLAQNVPPTVLAALVRRGVWTQSQGLSYARQVPDGDQRIKALAELLTCLQPPFLQQAVSGLTPELVGPVCEQALLLTTDFDSTAEQMSTYRRFAQHLPEPYRQQAQAQLHEAEKSAASSQPLGMFIRATAPIIQRELFLLSSQQRYHVKREARQRAWSKLDEDKKIDEVISYTKSVMEALKAGTPVPVYPPGSAAEHPKDSPKGSSAFPTPLEDALQISDATLRTYLLAKLAHTLTGDDLSTALRRALSDVRQVGYEGNMAVILVIIASVTNIPEDALAKALAATRAINDPHWKAQALISMAAYLPDSLIGQAVADVKALTPERVRAQTLTRMAPNMTPELLRQTLSSLSVIHDDADRTLALISLLPYAPKSEIPELLKLLDAPCPAFEGMSNKLVSAVGLLPYRQELRSDQSIRQILNDAKELEEYERANLLAELAPYLNERNFLLEALSAALVMDDENDQRMILFSLSPYLTEDMLQTAFLSLVKVFHGDCFYIAKKIRITDEVNLAKRISALASISPPYLRREFIRRAIHLVQSAMSPSKEDQVMRDLADELGLSSEDYEGQNGGTAVESEELEELIRLKERALVFKALAPSMPEALEYLNEHAAWPTDKYQLALILANVALYRDASEKNETIHLTLEVTLKIEDEKDRARMLVALAPVLPDSLLRRAVEGAFSIQNEKYRARPLARLAQRLCGLPGPELFSYWNQVLPALATNSRKSLLADIAAMGCVVKTLGGTESVNELCKFILAVGRWWR